MRSTAWKIAGVGLGIAVAAIAIGFYVGDWLLSAPPTYDAQTSRTSARITIQTVAAVGPKLSANPDWVSYLVRNSNGDWKRSTVWTCRRTRSCTSRSTTSTARAACATRSSAGRRGSSGRSSSTASRSTRCKPDDAVAHVRRSRARASSSRSQGVPDDAKNQCGYAPCARCRWRTGRSRSRSGPAKPGHYRWQCFVPCAAGFLYGFGGPMQTIGYMDGFMNVGLSDDGDRSRHDAAATDVRHGRRFLVLWLVLSVDRDAARRDLRRAADPARQRQRAGSGQVFSNQVLVAVSRRSCVFVVLFLVYALIVVPRRVTRRSSTARRSGATPGIQLALGRDHVGDGALPRRLRHLRARQGRRGRRPGADRRVPAGRALAARWTCR